jgi:hypothetical protein
MKDFESQINFPGSVWPDLVRDFLEMACFLRPEEQEMLVQELKRQNIQAESIDVYPCFVINGRVVIVCENGTARECWLYFVKKQIIQKWTENSLMEPAR